MVPRWQLIVFGLRLLLRRCSVYAAYFGLPPLTGLFSQAAKSREDVDVIPDGMLGIVLSLQEPSVPSSKSVLSIHSSLFDDCHGTEILLLSRSCR